MLKATHILFALAFVAVWFVWAIQQRCAWPFLFSVVVLLCANISCALPVQLVENQVGLDFGEGMPKTSWIEMGINPEGNGMYNTEVSENYAQKVLGEDSTSITKNIPSIPDSITYWATHPGEAFMFFTNKLVREWTQPDYASTMYYLGTNQPDELVNDRAYTNALIGVQNTGRDLYGGAQIALSIAAAFGFFMLLKQKMVAEKLILPACFVTGFLVFLLWEGQTIYVLPFWLCLLPVAAMGIDYVLSHIMEKLDSLE